MYSNFTRKKDAVMKEIIVAGGCFWGVEEYYKRLKGISKTCVGYANSNSLTNNTYEVTCTGAHNAVEAVAVEYDENVITLEKILEHLFRIIDPTSLNKQAEDEGVQYRVGAYYTNDVDKDIILEFVEKQKSNYKDEIVFEVLEVMNFFSAEDYHQKYLENNPTGYCHVDFSKIREDELKK